MKQLTDNNSMPSRPPKPTQISGSSTELPTQPTLLPDGGLRALIRRLGAPDDFGNPPIPRTGKIALHDSTEKRSGAVYLRSGRIYAASLQGFVPPITLRLLSGGLLDDEQFQALQKFKPEDVGPQAVALDYVTSDVIEDINRQMMLSTLTHMYTWRTAEWHWVEGEETAAFTISALETSLIISATDERDGQWNALTRNYPQVTKGNAVPAPGPDWSTHVGEATSPEINSILQYVDGAATIGQIAAVCGFSRFEIAARLAKAIADGLLTVTDPEAAAKENDDEIFLVDEEGTNGLSPVQAEIAEATRAVEHARMVLEQAEARLARAQSKATKNS